MNRFRLQVYYVGPVQGVGFRYTVKALALGFEVVGTIRNLLDGRVEMVAEGTKAELEAFQKAIHGSGLGRRIQREEAIWSEACGDFCGFEIVR